MSIAKRLLAGAVVLLLAAGAGAAPDRRVLAVLELRSSLATSARGSIDPGALEERVRAAAVRALPDVRVLERGQPAIPDGCSGDCEAAAVRSAGADWLVSGDLLRVEQGLLVVLELREARNGRLVAMQTAVAGTPQELPEAVASAARDLLKPLRPSLANGVDELPALPSPPGPLQEGGALNLPVDARALVAYDRARTADARGQEKPEEAALAWDAVAEAGGRNPYAEPAAARAAQWRNYAATRHAFEAQLASDTEQLRAVLPLASVKASARLELFGRYARAYGAGHATPLLALLPEELQARARLTLRCEAHEAQGCLALAKLADGEKDATAAASLFELACEAGAAKACAEAGERLLKLPAREPVRALSALQRGCALKDSRCCARLARIYEEGDGTDTNLEAARRLRDQACSAGDGRSCRKLACSVEEDAPALDAARAFSWSQRGCTEGDAVSCAFAKALAKGQNRKVVQPGNTVSAQSRSGSRPPVPFAFPPPPPSSASDDSRVVGGVVLWSVALVATAAWAADSEYGQPHFFSRRWGWGQNRGSALTLNAAPAAASGSRVLPFALGAGALATAGAGLTLILTGPAPSSPTVGVTASPGGLTVSGTLP